MFKKALVHQSNATPLRSSARRHLLTSVLAQHQQPGFAPLPNENASGDGSSSSSAAGPSGSGEEGTVDKELGKLIVPEGIRSGTFETSGGVQGTLYFGPSGDPLWMSFGRNSTELVPTLHLLCLPLPHPPLPVIQIYYPLPPPLLTGAPLFFAAVRNTKTPWLLPDVSEGGVVALAVSETGSASVQYVGVARVVCPGGVRGALARRAERIGGEDKEEGKFCDVLCIIDDHLTTLGSKPRLTPFDLPTPLNPLFPAPNTQGPPTLPEPEDPIPAELLGDLSIQPTPAPTLGPTLSASEISTLLSQALLQALSTLQPSSLPMPASLLYSSHVLPSRPAYIPTERRDDVVIAKSEWKKLAKWMKEVSKDGLVKIKETKGEVVVTGFDPKHPALADHVDFNTIAQEEKKEAKKVAREAAAEAPPKNKEMVIEELWKPSAASSSFWEAAGVDKNSLHPPALLKSALDEYINKHSLVDSRDRRLVVLDTELGRAVGLKHPDPGTAMPRDEVSRRLRSGVTWSVSVGGVVRKGGLSPVLISIKTRQGRKMVTLVSGLEGFGVDVDAFAEEMKKVCAGSASIQPLTGSSPKLNLKEVMVQGSQSKAVTEALVARGVPKRWIKEDK